jgi:hypothetical protein
MPHPAQPCNLKPRWEGQFTTFETWVNKASSWIDKDAVCIDAKGRRCLIGRDFMRARDEGAFPVRFFWNCEPLSAEDRAAVRRRKRLLQRGTFELSR